MGGGTSATTQLVVRQRIVRGREGKVKRHDPASSDRELLGVGREKLSATTQLVVRQRIVRGRKGKVKRHDPASSPTVNC